MDKLQRNIEINGLLRLRLILDELLQKANADEDETLVVKVLYEFYTLNAYPDAEDLGDYVLDLIHRREKSHLSLVVSNRNED